MTEIVIDVADAPTRRLWTAIAELVERLPTNWVLVGGLMVQLHVLEHGPSDVRVTVDIDVLGQASGRICCGSSHSSKTRTPPRWSSAGANERGYERLKSGWRSLLPARSTPRRCAAPNWPIAY